MTGAPLSAGSRIDDYEVIRELGRGAVGEAYAARAVAGPRDGQLVCLKVLAREFRGVRSAERESAIKHLLHEARVVSQLDHPNIARLLDAGVAGDLWYLAFELVEGSDLSAFEPDAFEPEHVGHLALELSKALACAHQHDVLHRDIKPSNILISKSGLVKLVDFGLAKLDAGAASRFSQHVGTPRYFSPEQLRGESLTAATDVYSLGLVLFELLAGCHPFYNADSDVFRHNVLTGVPQISLRDLDLPEDLVAIVERCIELDPSKRFADGSALELALSAAVEDDAASAADDTVSEVGVRKVAAAASSQPYSTHLGRMADRVADIRDEAGDFPTRIDADPTARFRDVTRIAPPAASSVEGQAKSSHRTDQVVNDISRIASAVAAQRSNGLEAEARSNRSGVRAVDEATHIGRRPRSRATSPENDPPATPEPKERPSATPAPHAQEQPPAAVPSPGFWTRRPVLVALVSVLAALGAAVLTLRPTPKPSPPPGPSADIAPPTAEAPRSPEPTPTRGPAEPVTTLRPSDTPEPPAATEDSTDSPQTRPEPTPDAPTSSTSQPPPGRARPAHAKPADLVSVTIGTIPYGEVIVDGRRVGRAPVVVKLSPGPHRVVGRSQELRRVETIVVSPDMNHVVLDLRNDQASP